MSKCTHGKHEICAECFNNLPSPADPQPASDTVEKVTWVAQEDAKGCGLAVLAMLTHQTYSDVRKHLSQLCGRENFDERGICNDEVDEYLGIKGFAVIRRFANSPFNMKPRADFPSTFAPIHFANVEQSSGSWHFIVVSKDGKILDPLTKEEKQFSDYRRVGSIAGVYPIASQQNADLSRKVRELETEAEDRHARILELEEAVNILVKEKTRTEMTLMGFNPSQDK